MTSTEPRYGVATDLAADDAPAAVARGAGRRWGSMLLLVVGLALAGILLVAQVQIAFERLELTGFLGAAEAKGAAKLHAAAAGVVLALAWALPAEWRRWVAFTAALVPVAVLVTTGVHGVAWSAAATVLLVAAMHGAGAGVVRMLGLGRLPLLITTGAGFAAVALAVQLLGRVGLLRWWTLGVPVMLAGAAVLGLGVARNARRAWTGWSQLRLTTLEATVAALLLLQLGWALVYAAAPEIQYDALSAKSALPQIWAESGRIETPLKQPGFAVLGSAQNVAVVGWLVGAEAVGRYLQLVLAAVVVIALAARGRTAGPVAWSVALALGVLPHYTWQAATAYDDDILLFVCAAAAAAVLTLAGPGVPQRGAAVLVGALAGSVVTAKLHLLVFAAVLAAGWVLVHRVPLRERLRQFGFLVAGGLAVAGPVPLFRYLDSGNPVFPLFNGIFKSPFLPPVSEKANFPYTPSGGLEALLRLPYDVTTEPSRLVEAQPPGSFGFILLLIVLGLAVSWRRGRAGLVVAAAMLVALTAWWLQLRYLRYLLPYAGVGAVLLTWTTRTAPPRPLRPSLDMAAATACAVLAAASFPSLLASFWNIPERVPTDVVLGRESAYDYQAAKIPGFVVLEDLNRLAGRGDVIASSLYPRSVLRPDLDVQSVQGLDADFRRRGVPVDTAADLYRAYRGADVRWVVLPTEQRIGLDPATPFVQLLATHGTPVSVAAGYEVYALSDRPQQPETQPLCDPRFRGGTGPGTSPTCWGAALDTVPGVTPAEAPGGVSQPVPVCPGATYAVDVDAEAPGTKVVLTFSQAEDLAGAIQRYSATTAGTAGRVRGYATAPSNGRTMFVQIVPEGGLVRSAQLTRVGGPDC